METMSFTNARPVEPRLAAHYQELLRRCPPPEDVPVTEECAIALVTDAAQRQASDLHIEPGAGETRIRMRVDGLLHDVAAVPNYSGHHLVSYFKVLAQMGPEALARPEHGHGRIEAGGTLLELRVTVAPTPNGEMAGIRLLNGPRPKLLLENIGMAECDQSHLRTWLAGIQGMLLVGGPVGTGKTSTLYAMLRELQTLPRSIVCLEDPVETNFDGITQIEVNEKRGLTFPEGIRSMLRLDPDFLLVGEIRDSESAHAAITAAGSGQAVLSTIHARDAAGTVTALRNHGVKNWEISAALEISVAQRLVRRLCPHCQVPVAVMAAEREWFLAHGAVSPESLWQPAGCDHCAGTGFNGRTGVFEVWRLSPEARTLILRGAEEPALYQHAMSAGTRPLLLNAIEKVSAGLTCLSEIRPLSGPLHRLPHGGAASLTAADVPASNPS